MRRCALRAGLEAAYTMDKETIVYRMAKTRTPYYWRKRKCFQYYGIAARTLRENGMADAAKEMRSRIMESGSAGVVYSPFRRAGVS